jgi:hypothetical protein
MGNIAGRKCAERRELGDKSRCRLCRTWPHDLNSCSDSEAMQQVFAHVKGQPPFTDILDR